MCSSRGGSVSVATSMLRRCSTVLPAGSSSSAWWVMAGPAQLAQDRRARRFWSSQLSTVLGRSRPARAWCRARSSGRIWPVVVAEKLVQALVDGAASAPAGVDATGLAAARAAAPELGVGSGAGGAQRLVASAAADRADLAAAGAAAPALLAGDDTTVSRWLWRSRRARRVRRSRRSGRRGPAVLAQRPVGCADGDRPAASALEAGLVVGRIGDQAVGTQRRPCSSRVAASRMAPQRAHGWARDLAMQLRHSHRPSIRRCRWMTRSQRGQGGRTIACAPASRAGRSAAAPSTDASARRSGEQLGSVLQAQAS